MRNQKYIQYVYHFPFPTQSIDVRTITTAQMEFCVSYYSAKDPGINSIFSIVERMFKEHFPEYVI